MFLRPIVKSEERVAIYGQHFIKAYRPWSGILPCLQTWDWKLVQIYVFGPLWVWMDGSCSGSQAAIVKEIVATDGAAARRMMSNVSQHVEIAKALNFP